MPERVTVRRRRAALVAAGALAIAAHAVPLLVSNASGVPVSLAPSGPLEPGPLEVRVEVRGVPARAAAAAHASAGVVRHESGDDGAARVSAAVAELALCFTDPGLTPTAFETAARSLAIALPGGCEELLRGMAAEPGARLERRVACAELLRRRAVSGGLPPAALSALRSAFSEHAGEGRAVVVAQNLAYHGTPVERAWLVEELARTDGGLRRAAARGLGAGPWSVAADLTRVLDDPPDTLAGELCVLALEQLTARLGPRAVGDPVEGVLVRQLLERLGDERLPAGHRCRTASVVARLGGPRATAALRAVALDPGASDPVASSALRAWSGRVDSSARVAVLEDSTIALRRRLQVARLCLRAASPEAAPAAALLGRTARVGEDPQVRSEALRALAEGAPGEVLPTLVDAGRFDPEPDVRAAAVLAARGLPAGREWIAERSTDDPSPRVRALARRILDDG